MTSLATMLLWRESLMTKQAGLFSDFLNIDPVAFANNTRTVLKPDVAPTGWFGRLRDYGRMASAAPEIDNVIKEVLARRKTLNTAGLGLLATGALAGGTLGALGGRDIARLRQKEDPEASTAAPMIGGGIGGGLLGLLGAGAVGLPAWAFLRNRIDTGGQQTIQELFRKHGLEHKLPQ